ncbi:MAG: DUF4176 domain-containing protein [Propionibacteriaceae bacterium]|jgi:hypothetical protein|nr:DUF4176 domain-containing protein [Propionibacteriaceae bacterium]
MQINGWAVIYMSYIWDEDLDDQLWSVVADVETYIETHVDHSYDNELIEFKILNGTPVLSIAVRHNHYSNDDRIFDLFKYIGKVAPGSYGQLHVYDADGSYGDHKTMFLLTLARGELLRWKDPFFNPIIPNVDGPYPGCPPDPLHERMPKYLPLGSVVTINGGEKKLMIFGRCQKDTANDRVFDYVGCPYPEGNITPRATFLFDHDDIAWVHYLGFADEDEEAWTDKLKSLPQP